MIDYNYNYTFKIRSNVEGTWGHVDMGVQYVHFVMHKCIMVKLEGKRKTQKACKDT